MASQVRDPRVRRDSELSQPPAFAAGGSAADPEVEAVAAATDADPEEVGAAADADLSIRSPLVSNRLAQRGLGAACGDGGSACAASYSRISLFQSRSGLVNARMASGARLP